jgi:hypothetical protein
MKDIGSLSKEELIKRLKLATDVAMAVDGMWFMAVEEADGFDKALELDIKVWERYAEVLLKRIRKYYHLEQTGLEGLKEVFRLDPLWDSVEFEVVEDDGNRLMFQVNRCPALEAMERLERKTYTCEPVETVYFTTMARLYDPRIEVKALKLPPRSSDKDICCQWLFYLSDSI